MSEIVFINSSKVAFDGKIDFSPFEELGDFSFFDTTSREELLSRVQGKSVLITKEYPLEPEQIQQFPESVKLICEAGTGYNNIDLSSAREKGISVCNVPGYSTKAVAQLAITSMLCYASSFLFHQDDIESGVYDHSTIENQRSFTELQGKTLGIIGFGEIAQELARIANAFGMNILVYTRTPKSDQFPGVEFAAFIELLKRSDFVSIHCPATPETRHLFDEQAFAAMKPNCFLVNTARGSVIDEEALVSALQSQQLAGAALDVLDPEPPEMSNPLLSMNNVYITPHIGWTGLEARQRLVQEVAKNIECFLADNPRNIVN